MAKLSTHILDTVHGLPAPNVLVELFALDANGAARLIVSTRTNADGRTDKPLLEGEAVKRGLYRLVFHAGDYFRAKGLKLAEPPFIDVVPIDFGIGDENGHYHVPLLCSPWTYSTYRGS